MAKSGSVSKAIYNGSAQNGNLVFSWSIVSQSSDTNSTVISWSIYRTAMPSMGDSPGVEWSATVNGVNYSGTKASATSLTYVSGKQTTITHNSDGKKTFSFSFSARCARISDSNSWGIISVSGSGSGTLDTIVRPASLTYASNFTNLNNPSITYSNPMGSAVTRLDVAIYDSSGSTAYATYRGLSVTGTSYTFSLTSAEKQAMINASSNNTLSVLFMLRTTVNDKTYYSSRAATFSVKRAAYITAATNFTDIENPTIKYYNQENRSTNLRACISLTGATDDIPYREVESTGSSYTFELTAAEREILINAVTSGNSCDVRFYLKSDFQGATYTTSLKRTFSLTDFEPFMDPVVVDMNSTTTALTGDINTLIQYRSTAACQFNAIAKKGATIKSYKIVNGSQTRDYDIAAIDKVESGAFDFTVTDSRGNSVTKTIFKPLIECIVPTCNQEVEIKLAGETDAQVNLKITGEWFNSTFGEGENAIQNELILQVRHTQNDGSMGDWVTLTDGLIPEFDKDDKNKYSLTTTISGFEYTRAYTFQCRALDLLGEGATTAEYKVKLIPVFDWSKEDFNFNVPVKFQKGFSIGDDDTLADYVVETGTEEMGSNGTWYWRKWASGKAECYGCRNYGAMAITTNWGGLYRSAIFTQDLPSIFEETPEVIDITYRNGNFGGWIVRHEESEATAYDSGSFILVRPASATLSESYISFNVIGRWK